METEALRAFTGHGRGAIFCSLAQSEIQMKMGAGTSKQCLCISRTLYTKGCGMWAKSAQRFKTTAWGIFLE